MKSAHPLPAWGLLGVLIACAITFYLLVPDQKRLLSRLVQDGKTKRALNVLHSIAASEKAANPEYYELIRLRLNRQLLDPKDRAGVIAQLEASLQAADRFAASPDFLTEAVASISGFDDCAKALDLVAPRFKTLPHGARQVLVAALVRHALASELPGVAAAAYEHCLRPFPPPETNLVEAVRLWRAAARPDSAIRVLEDYEQQSGNRSTAQGPLLMELKFGLLREIGRNSEAFDLAARLARQSGNGAPRQKWVQAMQATAGSADHHRALLKEYRQNVQANPTDARTWRSIAELSVAVGEMDLAKEALRTLVRLEPGDKATQKQLAQFYEWNGDPDLAFDLYLILAEQKDVAALDRLVALNPGLYRDKDLLRLLRSFSGNAHQDKYRLILARLLTKHGEYAEAFSLYRHHLQKAPQDVAVMEEYAQTLQRQQAYDSALTVWTNLQKLRPENESIRGHVAEVLYQLGDFENSLRAYQQLARKSTNLAAVVNYSTLAESLGDFKSLSLALGRQMELKREVLPDDFIKLAYVFNLLGADTERQRLLERGLAQFPDSDMLRIQLSFFWVEMKEPDRALPILAQSPRLKTDLSALRLYLELLVGSGEYATAEAFLKTGLAENLLEAPSIVFLRALIYEGNHNDAAAERMHRRLYRQHPGESAYALDYLRILIRLGKTIEARAVLQPMLKDPPPEVLREASHVYADLGDYKEAERLQARVMSLPGTPRLQDWSHLGDIRYSAGNRSAARRAYRQALASAGQKSHSPPP